METRALLNACFLGLLLSPIIGFVILGLSGLFSKRHSESFVVRVAKVSSAVSAVALAGLCLSFAKLGVYSHVAHFAPWFNFAEHTFDVTFSINPLSLGFLTLITILSALVSNFSETYIHQDPGFARFYILLLLATFGMTLVVGADSLGLTVIGWEFLGISSTLLIAFFHTRNAPIVNSLRAFIVYRIADIGLLLALMYTHHVFGTADLNRIMNVESGPMGTFGGSANDALIIGLLLLFSAAGKSSMLPFPPWLPRAMEGPTPSSAIFYGAFAVHAGPYLFLHRAPLVSASATLSYVLIFLGLSSALFSTLIGRTRPDVKTALAFATITQVSLIYAEIGAHWYYIAAFHTAGHMCLRTYQFLRAPSALHDIHVRGMLGVAARERGRIYNRLIPTRLQQWLYRWALEQGALATIYERYLIQPFLSVARALSTLEELSDSYMQGKPQKITRSKKISGREAAKLDRLRHSQRIG